MLLLCYWHWRIELKLLKNIKHTAKDTVDIVTEIVNNKDLESHLISALE